VCTAHRSAPPKRRAGQRASTPPLRELGNDPATGQPFKIHRADVLGGDDDDGNVCGGRIAVERVDDLETAHVGHQQVQQNQIG